MIFSSPKLTPLCSDHHGVALKVYTDLHDGMTLVTREDDWGEELVIR
jgi:hypothetical protein